MKQPDEGGRGAAVPPAALRDLYLEQVTAVAVSLRKPLSSDAAVHDTRKNLKRSRATLRLLRGALGDASFRRENRVLRDAARPLAAIRDGRILLDALAQLRRQDDGEDMRTSGRQLMRALRREQTERLEAFKPATLRAQAARLDAAAQRVRELEGEPARDDDVMHGLSRAYKKARAAWLGAAEKPSDDGLHEWRKQVKYLLNELDAIAQLRGRHFPKWHKRSERLAKLLGDDHDLAVLHQKITHFATLPPLAATPGSLIRWTTRLAKHRRRLQRKALRLGAKLFARKPKRAAQVIAKRLRAAAP